MNKEIKNSLEKSVGIVLICLSLMFGVMFVIVMFSCLFKVRIALFAAVLAISIIYYVPAIAAIIYLTKKHNDFF